MWSKLITTIGYFTLFPKANLEFNKEGLAADLVCLLEERSLPRNRAKFQEQIERFFIAGAARIDLIAKVIDLDNAIGGYNFDIPNLEETSNILQSLSQTGGKNYYLSNFEITLFLFYFLLLPATWFKLIHRTSVDHALAVFLNIQGIT